MKFYLKDKAGEPKLIMGIRYDKQFSDRKFVYSTGEYIDSLDWNGGKLKRGLEALSFRLKDISKECDNYILVNRRNLTKEGLRSHLNNLRPKEIKKTVEEKSMQDLWLDYLNACSQLLENSTYKGYKGVYNRFISFFPDPFPVNSYSHKKHKDFIVWLTKRYSANTVASTNKAIITFLKELKRDDIYIPDFMAQKPGRKISLSMDQLKEIFNHRFGMVEFPSRENGNIRKVNLDDVRLMWLVQCCTGLRIGDLYRILPKIQEGGDYVRIETQKVKGKFIDIHLPDFIRNTMVGYKLSYINESDYRRGIKEIYKKLWPDHVIELRGDNGHFKTVPVWQEISSHDAVRTFITISAERGVSVPAIAKVVGKSEKVIYSHYLNYSQQAAQDEIKTAWN